MIPPDEHLSRDERRRRSQAAILKAAQELFAESGYERTTIRGVAARAGVDPALVMQHYGSKEHLFETAARWNSDYSRIATATAECLPTAAIEDMLDKFERGLDHEAGVALLRNCLTHPSATRVVRDEVLCGWVPALESALEGPDADIRANLLGACLMGVGIARYVLGLQPLADMPPADLRRVLEPVLRALVAPATDGQSADLPASG